MQTLEKEVTEALAHLERTDQKKFERIKKEISHESLTLIQTLLLLLN
ncbi:hypothetical protein J2Z40_001007 [Cytobacillus eiseniae]|uniref:Uncharacterized protein n=2 Tax=Cytobacillus eiseniae TaxID=762947 RepID=A0ABS4RF52_9BACI|nr:hypothetical protein [Cytobacillus eiseniae]